MSENFKTIWVEFNQAVYIGEGGYVDSLKLDLSPAIDPARALAVAHWQEKGMWFFQLLDGKCVAVPLSNIRYVYGQTHDRATTGIQTSADAVEEDMPKRRGRPPKDKA